MSDFLLTETPDGAVTLYNLDQVTMVSEIRPGHCLITFAHRVTLDLDGGGADNLVNTLACGAQLVNGTSAAEMWARRKESEKSTTPKVIPFDIGLGRGNVTRSGVDADLVCDRSGAPESMANFGHVLAPTGA